MFLLEYSQLCEEDYKLHSMTFSWPGRIKPIIKLSKNRLTHKKDLAGNELKEKIKVFEQNINSWALVADELKDVDFSPGPKAQEDIAGL